jgi:hypothetical protein
MTSNLKLSDRRWKLFQIGGDGGVFIVERGRGFPRSERVDGSIPVVGSSSANNGIISFADIKPNFKKMSLSVSRNGSVGEAFFQCNDFFATEDAQVLTIKDGTVVTEEIGLFLSTIIRREQYRFGYGRKWGRERMERSEISLPVGASGLPDWQFMEDYIRSVSLRSIDYSKRNSNTVIGLSSREWKEFQLGGDKGLFVVNMVKSVDVNKTRIGLTPLVARTGVNNGIKKFINAKASESGNTISVPLVGTHLVCSYQDHEYIATQNVASIKGTMLNRAVSIFLIPLIKQYVPYYSYGRTVTIKNLRDMKLRLPVDANGDPDWEFMEDYIKSLPYSFFI